MWYSREISLNLQVDYNIEYHMKKLLFMVPVIVACLAGCHGTADPDVNNPENEDSENSTADLEGTITLYTDRDIIMADDEYAAVLKVLLMDKSGVEHDVTADVEIYSEGSDAPLTSPVFKTAKEGEYKFYALRGFDMSNTVSVLAIKDVPELPADPEAEALDFRHRMMLVQHTGNECPNCPRLMDILKRLSEDEDYNQLYYHVASHSYNETDNAYSSAAATLSKTFNLPGYYPWLTYNLTTVEGFELAEIKAAIDERHKDVAVAGICASAAQVGTCIYAQVALKAAQTGKYRVAAWLLEDGIRSVQSGATASWHHMHENCLRAMFGQTKNECIYGKPVGEVKAGETSDFIVKIDLESGWVAENCELIVLVVSGSGDYELLNCTVCPVGGTVSYDYL